MTRTEIPTIGQQIKSARKKQGLTLADLALKTGMSRSNISRIENEQANPIKSMMTLAETLGLELLSSPTTKPFSLRPEYELAPEVWAQLIALLDGCTFWQWNKIKSFFDEQFNCELGKTRLPELSVLEERIAHRFTFDNL